MYPKSHFESHDNYEGLLISRHRRAGMNLPATKTVSRTSVSKNERFFKNPKEVVFVDFSPKKKFKKLDRLNTPDVDFFFFARDF